MATIDVKDAAGATVALEKPLAPGRAAAASSRPVAVSTEDAAILGALTETAPATDTASSGLNGRLQRVAQRITSLIALLPAALGAGGGLKVDGSGTALPVSAASLPLPSGASTSANQATPYTEDAAGAADPVGLAVMLRRRDTPVSNEVTTEADNIGWLGSKYGAGYTTSVDKNGTVADFTVAADINVKQINGTTVDANAGNVSAGTQRVVLATDQAKVPVHGTVATNVAITANPMNLGAQAVSSENAAVTTARQVQLVADLVGKLIVLPYANPENFVSGTITSAMTGTTTTSLLAAPASGLRNYITQITVSNAHGTVGTDVIIQDGSGGTTLYTIPAAAVYGGATVTFPTPLRQPTTATAIFCANVTTGASTKVSASGYKGA